MGKGRPDSPSPAESWLPEGLEPRSPEKGKAVQKRRDGTPPEDTIAEQRARIFELERRIEELQSALADARLGIDSAPKRSRRPVTRKRGKLSLNGATFEELRDLGLSVTQSARLISYREARRGFDSLDELDEVPGFPAELKRALREQLELG